MSSVLLTQGRFETVGDQFTLELSPIFLVTSFDDYEDITTGILVDRFFTKEFRYSIDNKTTFTSYQALSQANLNAIVADNTKVYYFQIRYTRAGANTSGLLTLDKFCLILSCSPHALIHINKTNYDNTFGSKRFIDINKEISKFSVEALKKHDVLVGLVIDPSVVDLNVLIIPEDTGYEFNELLSTDFGNGLLKVFTRKRVDTFDGFESQ